MAIYEIIKNVIDGKNYELTDILTRIEKRCFEGQITEAERDELVALARKNANAVNSYASFQEQIHKIALEVEELRAEVSALKGDSSDNIEEYPEYVQPTGAHDAYKIGDKVTFEGKKYECVLDGCVWSPSTYPQGWREDI